MQLPFLTGSDFILTPEDVLVGEMRKESHAEVPELVSRANESQNPNPNPGLTARRFVQPLDKHVFRVYCVMALGLQQKEKSQTLKTLWSSKETGWGLDICTLRSMD